MVEGSLLVPVVLLLDSKSHSKYSFTIRLRKTISTYVLQLVDRQRQFFKTGATRSLNARRETLLTLKQMLEAHRNDIAAAIYEDIGRVAHVQIHHSFGHMTT